MIATEKKVTVLRGMLRAQKKRADRAARKAAKVAPKAKGKRNVRRSRGVNAYSIHDVTATIAAVNGDVTKFYEGRLDALRVACGKAEETLQLAIGEGDMTKVVLHAAEVSKLRANISYTVELVNSKVPTEDAMSDMDVHISRLALALVRSFQAYDTANNENAEKLGCIADDADRNVVRAMLVKLLEASKSMFPVAGQR